MANDYAVIAVTRDYEGKGVAPFILRSNEGEAGFCAFHSLARALERTHSERFPHAPIPDIRTQLLSEVSRLLADSHGATLRTPVGIAFFYDADRLPDWKAHELAADECGAAA